MTELLPQEIIDYLETKEGKRKFSEIIKENGIIQSKSERNLDQAIYSRRIEFIKIPRSVRQWSKIKTLLEEELNLK